MGRFGLGEKCVAWDAMRAAISPAESGRFRSIEGIRRRAGGLAITPAGWEWAWAVGVVLGLEPALLALLLVLRVRPAVLTGV